MGTEGIKNLNQFIEWAGQFRNGEYLYRGVSKSTYINGKVKSSAEYGESDNYEALAPLDISRELIEKARILGHDRKDGRKLSDLELLAELRHLGAATCLIDFTYNALVALWFACKESASGSQENGKVVVLRSDGIEPLVKVDYKMSQWNIDAFFKPTIATARYPIYQWAPQTQNNRIIAQHSVFVFSPASIDNIEGEREIKKEFKPKIMMELEELFGITEAYLFSDTYGFAWLHRPQKTPHIKPTAKNYRLLGIEALQKEDIGQAIEYLTRSVNVEANLESDIREAYVHRAVAYWRRGNIDRNVDDCNRAIDNCNKVIEYSKEARESDKKQTNEPNLDLAIVYNILGNAYTDKGAMLTREGKSDKGYFDQAIESYKKAIGLDPKLAKVHSNLGNVYAEQKNFDQAIESYNEAIRLDPRFAYVYSNRGEALVHKQEFDKAKKDLTKAREMGVDIVASFSNDYNSLEDFEQKTGIRLSDDVVEMLFFS